MTSSVLYTTEHTSEGRTIRYNIDETPRALATRVELALDRGTLIEIPNERGGEPIFLNPERVTSIIPGKEV